MNTNDPCAELWEITDWLTVEQAAIRWCGPDPRCQSARAAAIAAAVERGEIETREAVPQGFKFSIAEGLERGWVKVSRTSLDLWTASLPPAFQPRHAPAAVPKRNVSHILAIDALALAVGIDLGVRGGAAALAKRTQEQGREISADSAEAIADAVRRARAVNP